MSWSAATVYVFIILAIILFPQEGPKTLSLQAGMQSPPATIDDVAWIAGHWRGEAFGGIVEEIWSPPLGGTMMGSFKSVVNDTVRFYELISLAEVNNSLIIQLKHFNRNMTGWEDKDQTVDFPLVKIDGQTAWFEGMTFEKTSDHTMTVWVRLGENDQSKEMPFYYSSYKP